MIFATIATIAVLGCNNATVATALENDVKDPKSIYDFKMKNIDGKDVSLDKYKGKVLLVVNVASKCGLTPQYAGLQKLYTDYNDKGFEILGFPANNFGGQEPGTEAEIKEFCTANYKVTFPMFSKISVKGEDIAPLYKWLLSSANRHDDIEWNFGKFLLDKHGKVIARFAPKTTADSPELRTALDAALKA